MPSADDRESLHDMVHELRAYARLDLASEVRVLRPAPPHNTSLRVLHLPP